MTLPTPPHNFSTPIPNPPFEYPEGYYVETTQGRIDLNDNLPVDPETGAVSLA